MFFTKPDLDFSSGYVEPKPLDPSDTASIMDVGRAAYDSAKKTNEIMSGHVNLRSVYDDHNAKVKALTGADLANPENGDIGVYDFDTRRKIETDWQQYQSDGGTLSRNWFLRQWRENDYKRQLGELAEKHPDKRNEILPKTSFQSQAFDVARRAEETDLATWEKSKKGAAGWAAWLGGNLAAAATDPVNMITAPIGFGAGTGIKGLLAAALKAGAVNASVEAGVQPFVQDYRNQVGLTSGLGPASVAIGSAAVFGAGLDIGVRGTFRGVAHGFGYEPVVKDGIVVSWRKKSIDVQPSPEAKPQPSLHEIPHETMVKAADGDIAALRKVYENDAKTDPVVRQMLDAMDAEERLAAKPTNAIDDATHVETLTQTMRAVADPDSEPIPVRIDATPPVEGMAAKIDAELAGMKAKAAETPDNAELATRIADAEAQIRAIDGFGSDPVRDAALLRDGAPITTDMNLSHPGVQQARALAALSDEAFTMVRDGNATPELGAMVANFVGDQRQHSAILSDVVKMRPVSDREARAVIAELVRSPEYMPSTPIDMRRLDDPYGAEAKAQVAQLEREMQEELVAGGRATPEEIIATPEGQAAAIARANDVRAAIAELTGIAPPEIQVRVFSRIDDLPSNLSAKVRVANARVFSGALRAFQAAKSLDERLAAKLSLDAAARGEGIEGIADDAAIWIAAYAMDPKGRMAHEVVHALRTTGRVSPEEIRSLAVASREAGVWNKAREEVYRAEYSRRSGDVEDLLDEEAAAHFVEAVVRGDVVRPVHAKEAMSVVDRIRQFFVKLKDALTGRGFRDATVEPRDPALDVVDALLAGDIARREQHAEWMRHSGEAMYAKKDAEIGRSMRADLDQHGYFSGALRAARSLRQEKGTVEQMVAMLKKEGAKEAELESIGLPGFLDGKASVTKDEIVQFVESNRVRLNEVMYAPQAGTTKWSDYSLDPSNPTYRETVLHLPDEYEDLGRRAAELRAEMNSGRVKMDSAEHKALVSEHDALNKRLEELRPTVESKRFRSGHFPEPNIIGHMMTSMTRHDGKPVFTIDQIQSDWGQKIRDGGARDDAKIAQLKGQLAVASDQFRNLRGDTSLSLIAGRYRSSDPIRPDLQDAINRLHLVEAELRTAEAAPTSHPLISTTDQWTNTTLRRAIRQAAEADADYIAIPNGDTVLSYNPGQAKGMRGFYDSIVPKNLRNILRTIDKSSPDMIRVDKLETPTQGMKGKGFSVFPLTDTVKRSVLDDGQPLFAINAYHGSSSKFDEVDLDFVNAGAKSQKYGWGFYASSRQQVGTNWAHTVARNTGGRPYLYTVTLDAEPYQLMRWESKMSAQPEQVRRAVEAVSAEHKLTIDADSTGEAVYRALSKKLGERGASSALYDAGIRGNVQSNTTARNGTFDNYVMFDEADVRVETREPAPKPQLQSIADDVRETFSGLVEQMQGSAAEMARDPQFVAAITDRVSGLVGRYGTSAPDAEMVSAIVNRIAGGVTDGNGVIEAVTRELQAGLPSGNGPMFALRQTPDVDRVSALKRALEREIDAAQRGRAGSDAGAGKFIDAQGREGNRRTSEDFGAGSTAGDAARSVLKDRASRAAALEAFIAPELRAEAVNARAVSQGFTTVGYHGTYAAEIDVVNPFVTGRDFGFHFGTNPKAANSRLGVPSTLAEHLDSVLSRIFGGTSGARKPEDGSILPVRVRVTRPLRLPDVGVTGGGRWSDPVAMKKLLDHSESTAPGELRAWVSEWVRDNGADNQARRKTIADNHIFSKALAAELDRLGYDAIVYRNTVEGYGHDSMFVWHPEQVRSLFDFFHERADGPGLMASNDAVEADLVSRLEKLVEKNGIENQPLMFAMRDANGRMKAGAQARAKSLADDLAQIEYDMKTGSIDDRAALQQKRASLLNAKAEDAGLDDMNGHLNARGEKDAAMGYLRMVETYGRGGFKGDDVWTLKNTIANEAMRRMGEFVWTARKGAILGDLRRTVNKSVSARIENVIREAAGEQTSDAMAKRMAKAWLDTAEWLRQQFNAYGGDIGKLTGWFAPQYHDAQALLRAGRDAWVKYLMADGVLDRDRMLDSAGNRLSDSALTEMLTSIWRTITTGGAVDSEITGRRGSGALYKRHSEHRVLHFKGADAYLKYARDFGGGDVYAMMIGHVQTMARDIAALRRFGANPETVRGRLAEHLRREAVMQRSGRSIYDDLADAVADLKAKADVVKGPLDDVMRTIAEIHTELDGIANKKRHAARRDELHKALGDAHAQMRDTIGKGPMTPEKMEIVQRIIELTDEMSEIAEQYPVMSRDPVTRVERVITRADEMWKTYTGHTNTPVDGVIAGYMTAARNIVSSSTLAFAPISAITDQATGLAARAFVGMPVTQQLQSFLKSFSPANRREALELGFGLDQAAAAFAVQSRFAGWVDTRSISGYIADRGHAFSGLSPMTQASKIGFSSDFVRWMARLAKDHSFESLEPWTRDMLLRHGFTADDWSRLRTVSPEISRGVEVMSYQAIARQAGEELAEKYQRVHLRERAMAVLEPTLQGRTAFISETRPGTVIGEIMRSGAMLKSFPTSYMMLILGRFYDELQAGNMGRHNTIVAAASIFVVGTLLGALVRQAKSITQGRDAEDMTNPDFWAKSFMQSGGAGIFGDFMASAVSRTGGGFERTLAGPMPDRVANLFNLTVGNAVQYARDEKTNAGREAVKFAKQNTPLIPWYLRSAYEHMILDQIQSKVDPDVYRARQSRMQLFKKLNGTDFYWPPGAVVPTRSPNISRAFGSGK